MHNYVSLYYIAVWLTCVYISKIFLMFIYFWERQRQNTNGLGAERGRHRIRSRLQAPSRQHRARRRARTHEPWAHDLSRSQMFNRLSHPGARRLSLLLFMAVTVWEGSWHVSSSNVSWSSGLGLSIALNTEATVLRGIEARDGRTPTHHHLR